MHFPEGLENTPFKVGFDLLNYIRFITKTPCLMVPVPHNQFAITVVHKRHFNCSQPFRTYWAWRKPRSILDYCAFFLGLGEFQGAPNKGWQGKW